MRKTGKNLKKEIIILVLAGLVLLAAPLALSNFRLYLLGQFLTYAIVAIGLDLVWGYGGMLNLGQGVFFGLGAYAMAMYLKLENAGGKLPDFMDWSGLTRLPWFWKPFQNAPFAMVMAVTLPAVLAGLIGFVIFRSRIRGVYFSILTQTLALITTTLLISQQPFTGGTNGLTDFKTMFGLRLADPATQRVLYLVTLGCLVVTYLVARWLANSKIGKILVAIRDSEERVRFCGYDPASYKTFVFALAAGMAGLAGALFVPQVGIISPAMVGVVPSIEMVIWVALGGRGTLWGPVLGALMVNGAKTYFSETFPDFWLYFLGMLFIVIVLFIPDGVAGIFQNRVDGAGKPAVLFKSLLNSRLRTRLGNVIDCTRRNGGS